MNLLRRCLAEEDTTKPLQPLKHSHPLQSKSIKVTAQFAQNKKWTFVPPKQEEEQP